MILKNKFRQLLLVSGDYTFLKIGDTVLIKYSLKDPQTIFLLDKYYLKKHKGKYK